MKKLTFILIVISLNLQAQFKAPTYSNVVEGATEMSLELGFALGGLGTTVFVHNQAMHNDANLSLSNVQQRQLSNKIFFGGVVGSFGGYYLIKGAKKLIKNHKKRNKYKYRHRY